MSTDHAACSTARISVTVTDFLEIGRGSTGADIELTDTGHRHALRTRTTGACSTLGCDCAN